VVLAERVGGEGGDAGGAGGGDEVLDEEGADAAVVQMVGDREGDLGPVRLRGAARVVLGESDDVAAGLGQQGEVSWGGVARRSGRRRPRRSPGRR
jgi:hypothetical protein